jgi:CRP/FNR family transcriptional regulator, anaerobic regulatory protein
MNEISISKSTCAKCEKCLVNNRAICRAAVGDAIDELNRISHIRKFRKGQVIIAQGDDSSFVGNVVDGIVKLTAMSASGHQQIVGLLYPSDFFGRAFKAASRFSYEGATDVTLCCFDRRQFEGFLARHPDIEHELLLTALDELDASREWVAMVSGHTTMQRVAAFLFILARRSVGRFCHTGDNPEKPVISLPIGRRDIAAFLGTTPETLSRNIQTLVRDDVISPLDVNHFTLLDGAELVSRTGESREDLEAMAGAVGANN